MEKTKDFTELIVWQKAHNFVLKVYDITTKFPKTERYSLTSQFRRAAVSIPANIAEGYAKKGKADKLRYFNIAQGSIKECEYYLILAHDLNYIDDSGTLQKLLDETAKLVQSYSTKIRNSI